VENAGKELVVRGQVVLRTRSSDHVFVQLPCRAVRDDSGTTKANSPARENELLVQLLERKDAQVKLGVLDSSTGRAARDRSDE